MLAGPIGLVVLQPTSFCNIDCDYCYLPDRSIRNAMPPATVDASARLIFESPLLSNDIDIVWHGGEPLTLTPAYYYNAVAIINSLKPSNLTLHYGIQTNGTLINDAWVDLFERYDFTVGVSLDGPPDLHDKNRKYRSGAGSYARVLSGLTKLKTRGYPFHFIGVVTAATLPRAADLLRYYWQFEPTAIGLNIEEIEAQNRSSSLADASMVERFKQFIRDFLAEAARQQEPTTAIRDFQRTISCLASGTPEDNDQVIPLRIINIAVNGDISTFSPELMALDAQQRSQFVYGNVHSCNKLLDILRHPMFQASYAEICKGVERCARSCEYFQYCGGGAPVNKLSEKGTVDAAETMYCALTKKAWIDVCLEITEAPGTHFEVVGYQGGMS